MNKNSKRKIVFFDIDGTIYLYGKPIPADTMEAIRRLRQNGHLAILCTGRTKAMVFPEIFNVGFDGMIAGAGTYVEFGGNVIHEFNLPESTIKEIATYMKKAKIMAILEGINHVYFDVEYIPEEYVPIYELYLREVGANVKDIRYTDKAIASKISGIVLEDGDYTGLRETYGKMFHIVEHKQNYLEMIPNGYSKAVGIERMIKELGIPLSNTYAFGDSMNDYEMLKYVTYGVAMGNADEAFKAQMNYVTERYDEGGIYNALERFGLI